MNFLIGLGIGVALIIVLSIGLLIKLKKYSKRLFGGVLIGLIALIGISLYSNIVIRTYPISTSEVQEGNGIKIALLTDLHSYSHGKNQEHLLKRLKEQEPDLILMSGDIVDDEAPIVGTEQLLEGLRNTVPIFYVTGNHEYWTRNIEGVKAFMESYGVTVLEEEYVVEEIKGTRLVIAGMSDPDKWRLTEQTDSFIDAYNTLQGELMQEEGYKILISHRPEFVDLYDDDVYDLVVSGHAHGGQVRIPGIINGLYAPNQGGFPSYAGGLYHLGDKTQLVVSRGLSINWKLPRIFNPPELVMITLEGSSKK